MTSQNLILGLIYLIVGFGVLGTILMMTMERMHEFGMVTAIGMKRSALQRIVIIESVFLTLVGALAAMAITYPFVLYFHLHPIPLSGKFAQAYIEYGLEPILPLALKGSIFFAQTVVVVVIALIASAYPLFRIGKLDSIKAMHTVH